MTIHSAAVLELVQEAKISDLLGLDRCNRFEASGVYMKDGTLHIIFDNLSHVMLIKPDWVQAGAGPILQVLYGSGTQGYEDITFRTDIKHWYCLIEAERDRSGVYKPYVDEFDESFVFIARHPLDFSFVDDKKGFEGLATLHDRGHDYLLGLNEDDQSEGGKFGRGWGSGRIQVFEEDQGRWKHIGTVRLPEIVQFADYSSLDFQAPYMTVLSQESSAMWVGRVRADAPDFDHFFEDEGRQYSFPLDYKGRRVYWNLEGIAWIGEGRLAVVSDKKKPNHPGRGEVKDQSVHILKLVDEEQV